MMGFKRFWLAILIAILLSFVAQDSYANVLVNPGFESGTGVDADNWTESGSVNKRLYHLNDLTGTNVNDSASDSIDGTIYGNPVWKDGSPAGECPGNQNGCLDLDGTGDYVGIGNALGKPANYTIEAWIRPVAWTNAAIVSSDNSGTSTTVWGLIFRDTNDDVEVWTSNGMTYTQANVDNWNSTNYPSGSWTHIAATVDGTNIKFYRNGTLISTIAQTVAMGGTAYSFSIGRLGEYAGFYFNGDIDEVAIYNIAITQDQIRTDCGWNGSTCAGHELTGTEVSYTVNRVSGANCRTGTYCMEVTLSGSATSDLYLPSNNYSTGTFSVYAKADASRTTDIILLDQDNTVLCTINATLTTSYAQYSKTCGFNGWVKKVKLKLDMVTTSGTVWLDDADLSFQETYVSPSALATIGSGMSIDFPKNQYLYHVGNAYWAFFTDGDEYRYVRSGNGGETWDTSVLIATSSSYANNPRQLSVWYSNVNGHDRFYEINKLDTSGFEIRKYGLDNSTDTTLTWMATYSLNGSDQTSPHIMVDDGSYVWYSRTRFVTPNYRFVANKSVSRLEDLSLGWETEIVLSGDIAANVSGSCLPLNTLYYRGWGDGTAARVLCQWNENGIIKYRYSSTGSSFAAEVTVTSSVVADTQSVSAMVDSKYNIWFSYIKTDGTLAVKKLSYPYTASDLSSEVSLATATVDHSYISMAVGDDDVYVAYEKGGALYYRKHIETDDITTWQTETTLVASGVDSGPLGMAMNVDRFGYLYRSGTDLKFIKLDLNTIVQRGTRGIFTNTSMGPLQPKSVVYCNNIITFGTLTADYEVQFSQYNLTTETYSDIYTLKRMARDDHGYPEIVADSSCYLYIMVGGRLEDAAFYKSNSPNDITSWTLKNSFADRIYHQMHIDQADIIHWVSHKNTPPYPKYIYYRKYTTSTSTWASEVTLVQPASGYEFAYPARFSVGTETSGQKSLHLTWVDYDTGTLRGKGLYYMKSTDGGSTWKKADGTTITLPADNTDADVVYSQASGELYAFAGLAPGNTGTPRISTTVLDSGDTYYELRYFYWNGSSWVARPITDQTEIGDPADYGSRMLRDDSQGITYIYGGRHPVGSRTAEAWQWTSTDDFQTFTATKIIGNYDDNFWYPTEFLAGPMLITTWNRRVSLIHGEIEWFVTLRPGVKDKLLNYKLNSSINPNIN